MSKDNKNRYYEAEATSVAEYKTKEDAHTKKVDLFFNLKVNSVYKLIYTFLSVLDHFVDHI